MKVLILFALVALAATFSMSQGKVKKAEDLVRETDSKLKAALLKGDVATVDGILADDYTETNAQGEVRHKSDLMVIVRAQASAPKSISIGPEITEDEAKLRIYGDTAVFTGLTTTRYQHMEYQTLPGATQLPPPNAIDQERFLKVYSKIDGRWQLIASQRTAIAKR